MIDYIALSIGHGLITLALVRLFLRTEVDFDPLIEGIRDKMRANRSAATAAGRNAKRRGEKISDVEAEEDQAAASNGRRRG